MVLFDRRLNPMPSLKPHPLVLYHKKGVQTDCDTMIPRPLLATVITFILELKKNQQHTSAHSPVTPYSTASFSMVALDKVQQSNAQITSVYPTGLVAVFAGATAGIGETSLGGFARHTPKPRVYIIGRSQEACDRKGADLQTANL